MTKTDRNRKLMLSEAGKYYWHRLFYKGGDWESDLVSEVVKRLNVPEEGTLVFLVVADEQNVPIGLQRWQ